MLKQESDIKEIVFSFRYYDTDCSDWCISEWEKEQIKTALTQLKEINQKKITELCRGKPWHSHPVEWKKTIYRDGFPNKSLREMESWQIALPSVKKTCTRFFGVIEKNIFHIVWFDLNHKIWPTKLKNT